MILEEKFLSIIQDFCDINKIKVVNGRIPEIYSSQIQGYIKKRLQHERAITRNLEKQNEMKIGNIASRILFGIQVLDSPIEQYLWDAIEREGLDYLARRQFEIKPYKIDIAFPIARLAVECDGREYHRENVQQLERDQRRDKFLARKGWRTLRIEGIAIRKDIQFCIKKIKDALGDLAVVKHA
jgi:very-short-patch-repair endonuclease